jgi:nicotinic acid mononucleotide adenylyltransferase
MKQRVNIVVGRFQPLTYGHMKCVDAAWEQAGLPTVMIIIDTPQSKVDNRHPFPTDMILPIYQEVFKRDKKVIDIFEFPSADIVKIGEMLDKEGYEIASWTCGTDRIASYSKMSEKYHDKAHLTSDFKMIEVPRTAEDISASKARKLLLDDDLAGWRKITPLYSLKDKLQDNKIYKQFRKQLLSVQ